MKWNICRNIGCEFYSNGFAGHECTKGLRFDEIKKCQNMYKKDRGN